MYCEINGKKKKLCLKDVDDLNICYYIGFHINFLTGIGFFNYGNQLLCGCPAS